MPKLVALYIRSVAIGFAISAGFLAVLIWQDVAGLGGLILGSSSGLVAAIMLFMSNGIIFSGVQFAIAVMAMAEPQQGPRGGTRAPVVRRELIPIKVEIRSRRQR
jgi:anti-sigma factor RsiW